jgi:hypothetical protein
MSMMGCGSLRESNQGHHSAFFRVILWRSRKKEVMMVTLTLSDQQIVDLVKQLPPTAKQTILDVLIAERETWWDMTVANSEKKMRALAQKRGLDWDKMSEDEREKLVDDLMHE